MTGTNALVIQVISGSSGTGFLSPGYSYDAIELDNYPARARRSSRARVVRDAPGPARISI